MSAPISPILSHAEPVLPVADVRESIKYWQDVLAFPTPWTSGDPPTIGAVSWHGAHVQFYQDPEKAKLSTGNAIWIRVRHIDELYKIHTDRKANIVEPLKRQSWGMDQYVVKDLNGYYVLFAGHSALREKSGEFPESVVIVERIPTQAEYTVLMKSVGWFDESITEDLISKRVKAAAHGVVAIDQKSETTIGCALMLTDHASFYYIKDLMVEKSWQSRRIGTALLRALTDWLERNAVPKSLVGLYTGENLEPFYTQFGFTKTFGMIRWM